MREDDLWNMIPLDVQLFTGEVTGRRLRELAESWMTASASAPIEQKGGYFTRQAGMNIIARINNPDGFRVEQLFIGRRPYKPDRRYSVVFGGQQVAPKDIGLKRLGPPARDVLRDYLARHDPVRAELTHDRYIWV